MQHICLVEGARIQPSQMPGAFGVVSVVLQDRTPAAGLYGKNWEYRTACYGDEWQGRGYGGGTPPKGSFLGTYSAGAGFITWALSGALRQGLQPGPG